MTMRSFSTTLAAVLLAMLSSSVAWGQNNAGFFNNRAVGGVSISPEGVLSVAAITDFKGLRQSILEGSSKVSSEITTPVELRKISLRQLEAALQAVRESGKDTLPDEIKYLAGIQRIQYVFVYPEQNDIVLAGPGEGWKVDDNGYVVGVTTGNPVLRLDDLLVAFRTTENARKGGLTCSIDPTKQGLAQFEEVVKAAGGRMQPGVIQALEKAMGSQDIKVTGVPDTSRLARVLVAADYRMKRYAMELDQSPKGVNLPSFLGMLKSKKSALNNMLPPGGWPATTSRSPRAKTAWLGSCAGRV